MVRDGRIQKATASTNQCKPCDTTFGRIELGVLKVGPRVDKPFFSDGKTRAIVMIKCWWCNHLDPFSVIGLVIASERPGFGFPRKATIRGKWGVSGHAMIWFYYATLPCFATLCHLVPLGCGSLPSVHVHNRYQQPPTPVLG